jgi:hypothetical protein
MASPSVRLPADLGAAQRRVECWRSKSNGLRRPLPEWVWDLAADLVPSHGVYRVSRVLRLEYHKVKERAKTRQSARQKVSKRPVTKRKKPVPEPPTFVEVSAPPAVMSSAPGYTVELADERGRRMTIRCSAGMDVAVLVAAWFGEASCSR